MVPLVCRFLEGNCDRGISCDLLLLNFTYGISVAYVNAASGFVFEALQRGRGVLGTGSRSEVNVSLPFPPGAMLTFTQRSVSNGIRGFQVRGWGGREGAGEGGLLYGVPGEDGGMGGRGYCGSVE